MLGKSKKQIFRIYMIRVLFVFKLIYINITYIILNDINGVMGFNSFINDYLRY